MNLNIRGHKRFLSSIRFKFVIVYVLVNIISMQVIGLYFSNQLKAKNINTFQTSIIEQEKKLNYNIQEELIKKDNEGNNEKNIDADIRKIASEYSSPKLILLNIVDKDLRVIASSATNGNENYLGKRSVDPIVKQAIKEGKSIKKEQTFGDKKVCFIYANPIKKGEEVLGVTYIVSDIESVYNDVYDITKIFILATIFSLFTVIVIGLFAAKTITNPIEKMSAQVKTMVDGDYRGVIGIQTKDEIGDLAYVFNQISAKIKEEQAVTESEKIKLDTIINSMGDGIISADSNGKIVLINESAKEILNIAENEEIAIGKDALEILGITQYKSIKEIILEEDSILITKTEAEEEYLYRLEFTEVLSNSNNNLRKTDVDSYIIVLYDVTEKEREEKERREFVSTVSHELRTPLTTMVGYVEMLEEGAIKDKKLAGEFINTIHKETKRMIRMVNELMQLGKMDREKEHYNKELIDINKLIGKIVERFQMAHPEKEFKLLIPAESIFVEADQDKLIQVFDNIINNAIKYSPGKKDIMVRVRQNHSQSRVSINVKDNGIGIPISQVEKVFNRFYRVDKSRQREMGGTGLGLSLAKSIVEAHKGKIWIQSKEKYGTSVFVMLPSVIFVDEWE